MRTINLPVHGITLNLAEGSGTISSDLHDEGDSRALDALESLILAHAVAGVDVESPAYLEGIETALDALANN
jgi:hypothetical protein